MPYILPEGRQVLLDQLSVLPVPKNLHQLQNMVMDFALLCLSPKQYEENTIAPTTDPAFDLEIWKNMVMGDWNYVLSVVLHDYAERTERAKGNKAYPTYQTWNDLVGIMEQTLDYAKKQFEKNTWINQGHAISVIGMLRCCQLEMYHACIAPYEDTKREQNGSVSVLDFPGFWDKEPEEVQHDSNSHG